MAFVINKYSKFIFQIDKSLSRGHFERGSLLAQQFSSKVGKDDLTLQEAIQKNGIDKLLITLNKNPSGSPRILSDYIKFIYGKGKITLYPFIPLFHIPEISLFSLLLGLSGF